MRNGRFAANWQATAYGWIFGTHKLPAIGTTSGKGAA